MKRFIWSLIIILVLGACSRNRPTSTPQPSPTGTTPAHLFTPTPPPTRVSRITIVPSATRLPPPTAGRPVQSSTPFTDTLPTDTLTPTPSVVPSLTPTPRIVNAGATDTPAATAPPPDSPLPTPTSMESPVPLPETPTLTVTSDDAAAEDEQATPTLDSEGETPPTHTPTRPPEDTGANWRFENVDTYYDEMSTSFYISGQVVNQADSDQRITTLWPVVYDLEGNPVNTKEDVKALGKDYSALREGVSLALGSELAFSFRVDLSTDAIDRDSYDFIIESEPANATRQDLEIVEDNFDDSAWPDYFYVEGVFANPGPDLNEYIAIVVTLYDQDGRVVGIGWVYEQDQDELANGEHSFQIEVETWEGFDELGLEVETYTLQLFGY